MKYGARDTTHRKEIFVKSRYLVVVLAIIAILIPVSVVIGSQEEPAESMVLQGGGMGDITFDLAYARTTKSGIIWAAGIVSTIPTATDDELGNDRWTLGPEFLIGKLSKK